MGSTKPASRLGRERKLRIGRMLYHVNGTIMRSFLLAMVLYIYGSMEKTLANRGRPSSFKGRWEG